MSGEIPNGNAGWREWSRHVLSELKRQRISLERLESQFSLLQIEIATLKAKASFWGATAGAIVVLITGIIAIIAELSAK